MPNLSPAEKQDVIRHLEADRPLPERYRFLLFDDRREVEDETQGSAALHPGLWNLTPSGSENAAKP